MLPMKTVRNIYLLWYRTWMVAKVMELILLEMERQTGVRAANRVILEAERRGLMGRTGEKERGGKYHDSERLYAGV